MRDTLPLDSLYVHIRARGSEMLKDVRFDVRALNERKTKDEGVCFRRCGLD